MKITQSPTPPPPPANGNPGIVPPWLQQPVHTWSAPVATGKFELVVPVKR